MVDLSVNRYEALRRIDDTMYEIHRNRRAILRLIEYQTYESLLKRMTLLGYPIDDFVIPDVCYRPDSQGKEKIVGARDFDRYSVPFLRFVRRQIEIEGRRLKLSRKLPKEIIEQRRQLLALLVDAYLVDQSTIHVRGYDGGNHLLHPGLDQSGMEVNMSDLEALSDEGLIQFRPTGQRSTWAINIPSRTLAMLSDSGDDVRNAAPGQDRQEAIRENSSLVQHFYGNVGAVAANNQSVTQNVHMGFAPGDLEGLRRALSHAHLDDEKIEVVVEALVADEREAGRRSLGDRFWASMASISSNVGAGVAVEGIVAIARHWTG